MLRLILKISAFLTGYGSLIVGFLILFGVVKLVLEAAPGILFAELLGTGLVVFGFWALGKYQKL